MELQRILFISVVSITLWSLSLLTARIYAVGFKSGTTGVRIATIIGALFPLIFIGANVLGRYSSGTAARLITVFSDTLGGFGLYALVTSIVLGIVLLAGRALDISLPAYIATIFLSIAGLLGIVGLVQARIIQVVDYTVHLENAPATWDGRTAILLSDTHFGLVHHALFSQKITDKILSLNPNFVMHAGDLYDGPSIATEPLVADWKRITTRIPFFFAPGNHEEYGPYSVFLQSAQDAGITVLDNKVATYDGVQIAGITYRNKRQAPDVAQTLSALPLDPSVPGILINHPPTFQEEVKNAGIDLMVSGHTHRGQLWPIMYIVRAIYGKYTYGLNIDDTLTTITTSGVGTAGPPLRLFNIPELVRITFKTK